MKLYTWKTPNGYKMPILLEELGQQYEIVAVNLEKGEQKTPEFLAMNPNHKIPVLVDGDLTLFESGAILIYVADKFGKFLPTTGPERYVALEWLMFQMANVGPFFGKITHFKKQGEKGAYGVEHFLDETKRVMGVLETRLSQVPYLAGEYGIADIATWPWIRSAQGKGNTDITQFPAVEKWYKTIEDRDAVKRAIEKVDAAAAAKQ
jgi:GSH-dependent disulfide-bond oxidoreductase